MNTFLVFNQTRLGRKSFRANITDSAFHALISMLTLKIKFSLTLIDIKAN